MRFIRLSSKELPKDIQVQIPWPPSANRYWRIWNRGLIISKEAREYKKTIRQLSHMWPEWDSDGRLNIQITAFPPDKRARDLDNLLKITLDSLEGAKMFENDSQFDKIEIERGDVFVGGRLNVSIQKRPSGKA